MFETTHYHRSDDTVLKAALGFTRRLKERSIDLSDYDTAFELRMSEMSIIKCSDRTMLKHNELTPEVQAFFLEIAMLDKEIRLT